ncbi:hypothetical protein EST38_g9957 [Candolleomyces aberdarensis]|uniref:Uncharacterized protein n=1 Tax=Candolleomyces aberdarensis TaxID=2316362 RepID=A0A4Q2D8M9_9AGAR|nr:hypothetical protein EST38_g9957 [Candolleomyces aberdarensis]
MRSLARKLQRSARPFNIAIIDAFKEIVLNQPPPEIIEVSIGASKAVQQAEYSIHCIFAATDLLMRAHSRTQVGRSLLARWGDITAWVNFIAQDLSQLLGPQRREVGELIRCCANLLAQVAWVANWPAAIFLVDSAADAIVSLWTYMDSDGYPLLLSSLVNPTGCPVISLFENWCLRNRNNVLSKLQKQSGDSLKTAFHFASRRLKSLTHRLAGQQITIHCAISDICAIWKTTVRMIEVGPAEEIYDALIRFKFFHRIVESLNKLTQQPPTQNATNLLQARSVIIQASDTMSDVMFGMLLSTNPVRAIVQGIRGGLHDYLLRHFLPHADTGSRQYSQLLDAYKNVSLHCIYPAVRRATIRALPNETSQDFEILVKEFPDFENVFNMLDFAKTEPIGRERGEGYRKQLCDSPMVRNTMIFFLPS